MGAWCINDWIVQKWDPDFMLKWQPSIEYLELYAVTVAVMCWIDRFRNQRICLFCDNLSVVNMINSSSSKCKNCMVLIRIITLKSLIENVRVYAKHVSTSKNDLADALSRGQFNRFWKLAPESMHKEATPMPTDLWPMEKLWFI